VVADTVAAPIEQQINGVEGMVWVDSESRNDGSYKAHVRFAPNTDLKLVFTLLQSRVALAKPVLPEAVQWAGVAVKVEAAEERGKNRVAIAVVDRGGQGGKALRRLAQAVLKRLSAERAIVKPEMFPGPDENQVSVQVDRAKCAKYGVSVAELVKAMQAAGPGMKIEAVKRLHVTSVKGEQIPLGAVAAVELASGPTAAYRVNMYPAVRVTGSLPEGKTTASAVSRCAELADAERESQNDSDGFAVVNLTAP
jgi:multidrug efflux pump subunit AcrB